ncbi:hypothetical protein DH2020_029036 [Rehmannia glutinosa]|uniref:Tf2-1-like SH3-like domain-containing protein n=1 Tax=Rehmannia glutinosa TaxID=99300 RepID=A0ABR0VT23_REHGL
MLRACVLNLGSNWETLLPLVEFAYNNSYQATIGMAPYEALYGKKCRSSLYWNEVGEKKEKAYTRYIGPFEEGEKVFLKVAPIKGVIRFGENGKLKPRYIGPFEILTRIGDLAYQLTLPPSLSSVHNIFHVLMLRKYVHDPSHIMNYKDLEINKDLTYEEGPESILERKIHKLRNKEVALIKVQWRRHGRNEATWEREEEIRAKYPKFIIQGK